MLGMILSVAVLSVLYGLAWHDQPAREPERSKRSNRS
jgi:hypothetical protein